MGRVGASDEQGDLVDTTVELTRFSVAPEKAEALLAARPAMPADLSAA
jgi:hypothetical protein